MTRRMHDAGFGDSKATRPTQLSQVVYVHHSRHLACLITTAALVSSMARLSTEQAEVGVCTTSAQWSASLGVLGSLPQLSTSPPVCFYYCYCYNIIIPSLQSKGRIVLRKTLHRFNSRMTQLILMKDVQFVYS